MAKPSQRPPVQVNKKTLALKLLVLALPLAIPIALLFEPVYQLLPSQLQEFLWPDEQTDTPFSEIVEESPPVSTTCEAHKYTTEIVSLDPLVIYINNFTSHAEAEELIKAGEEDFEDSFISRTSGLHKVTGRTSQSAPLDLDIPIVQCILSRARTFLGTSMRPSDTFSIPQIVRYFPGQKYDLHTDFWPQHQITNDGSNKLFNRQSSFFVFLRDNCTEGETYFPLVDVLDNDSGFKGKAMRGEKDGVQQGVKFKPITGNAVFWVNLDGEGVGDRRVVHAGLPVGEGEKIGLNIWPRRYFGKADD
ncbi:hypothetical protein P154DRAFT_596836 [Amniculicola lignicola CBS 123094]|uniref:Fe2OG dioxygenase domain-containing protein n=1 Tax=Amniculicola lignicola CBS 123094 TaxID=1392246 RepID=A0A6A5WJL8_9PLEO|nr:hypothetical protein P154DRAFT_596836 [Amniculicola lignicola CBS 123094]